MQGSKEDCLPMKGHTRGGRTHNVTQRTDTHIFTEGGDAPTMAPNERTHVFSHGGGTHPQCNPTNGHAYFFGRTKLTHGQSHILRQHAA